MPPDPRTVVVFDFDGTLADTWRDLATALNHTLKDAGLEPVDGPDVRFWIGDGALKLLQRAVPEARRSQDLLDELYARFRVHYERCCLDTTDMYPGVLECLDRLAHAELAVLSNKPALFLDRVVEGLGLKPYFRIVLGGDSTPKPKPDPVAMQHLLDRLGYEPGHLWMVGDSAVDIHTGKHSGAKTIGCTWGLRGREELRAAQPDHLIDSASEIPALVRLGNL